MKIFSSLAECALFYKTNVAVAIGKFDGIHLGHQKLLSTLKEHSLNIPVGVLSFEPLPKEILDPSASSFRLTNLSQKANLLKNMGVDFLCLLPTDKELLQKKPEVFAHEIVEVLGAKTVVVGDDFCFGHRKQGDVQFLKKFSHKLQVYGVPEIKINGEKCSSSLIKSHLQSGQVKKAQECLGRKYSFLGTVIHGYKKGTTIGFPTANLSFNHSPLKYGVYFTTARVFFPEGFSKDYPSISNVGVKPTVQSSHQAFLECHILGEKLDLYGFDMEIFFEDNLREEQKFPSIKSLQEQIQLDVAKAQGFFAKN